MTFWELLCRIIKMGGIPWTLLVIAIVVIIWLLAHPQVVKEWNVQISMWIAAIRPQQRKKAFEKRLNLTIDSAKTKFNESAPPYMKRFLPYDLKIEWVDEKETMETVTRDKQVIVYVPTYRNELSQAVCVLHSYCSNGFANKAKVYMPEDACKATDLVVTQNLTKYAGHSIYDYFNREYLPELLNADKTLKTIFEMLQKVDRDGLFMPVLLNEIDKYSNILYPAVPTKEVAKIIVHLMDFIYKIISRYQGENVPLIFCEDQIKIKIILAVSDIYCNIDNPVRDAENALQEQKVNTVYVLATGSKIPFAQGIAERIYERNPLDVYEPIETKYKRYTQKPSGSDSICYEINRR